MKIECHCGQLIVDQTDHLPGKGHVIPDQDWLNLIDNLDRDVIDRLHAGHIQPEAAAMALRTLLNRAARPMFQCSACGRLYLDDFKGRMQCFRPRDDGIDKRLLRGRS